MDVWSMVYIQQLIALNRALNSKLAVLFTVLCYIPRPLPAHYRFPLTSVPFPLFKWQQKRSIKWILIFYYVYGIFCLFSGELSAPAHVLCHGQFSGLKFSDNSPLLLLYLLVFCLWRGGSPWTPQNHKNGLFNKWVGEKIE